MLENKPILLSPIPQSILEIFDDYVEPIDAFKSLKFWHMVLMLYLGSFYGLTVASQYKIFA